MKYYCEKCGKTYNNQDECFACEKKHLASIFDRLF